MKKLMLLMLAVMAGCATVGCETKAPNPANGDCKEFDYKTVGVNSEVSCRMLWCQSITGGWGGGRPSGGIATLWCADRNNVSTIVK